MTKLEKRLKFYETKLSKSIDFPDEWKDPTEYWIILVDGKRGCLSNGKKLWKQKNHAKCAVRNEMEVGRPNYRDTELDRQAQDLWMEKHLEIIPLEQWKGENKCQSISKMTLMNN